MVKVTYHGKIRINERIGTTKRKTALLRTVLRSGLNKNCFKGQFYDFLNKRARDGIVVKVYNDDIYIISKNSRNLITAYGVPDRYLPIEKYKKSDDEIDIIGKILKYSSKNVILTLRKNRKICGKLSIPKHISKFYYIFVDDVKVSVDDIISIKLDESYTKDKNK